MLKPIVVVVAILAVILLAVGLAGKRGTLIAGTRAVDPPSNAARRMAKLAPQAGRRPEPALSTRDQARADRRRPLTVVEGISLPQESQVIWRPEPESFGLIPTQWSTRPQLLPGIWDVMTILAADDSGGQSVKK